MRDMFYRSQPFSEIMKAKYSDMKMCYQMSVEIADGEEKAVEEEKAKAAARAGIKP